MRKSFGQLISERRAEQGLTLQALARKTGTDVATISRIEHERTLGTLLTAIRLCEGLGIDASEVYPLDAEIVQRPNVIIPVGSPTNPERVLTPEDVRRFLAVCVRHPRAGKELLARLLNEVLVLERSHSGQINPETPSLFVADDIDRFLSGRGAFQFALSAPAVTNMDEDVIRHIYTPDAAYTIDDVIQYTTWRAYIPYADGDPVVIDLIDRLQDITIDRLKFADVLKVQEVFERNENMLALYWRAGSFHIEVARRAAKRHARNSAGGNESDRSVEAETRLARMFVTTCRWLLLYHQDNMGWIRGIRAELSRPASTPLGQGVTDSLLSGEAAYTTSALPTTPSSDAARIVALFLEGRDIDTIVTEVTGISSEAGQLYRTKLAQVQSLMRDTLKQRLQAA